MENVNVTSVTFTFTSKLGFSSFLFPLLIHFKETLSTLGIRDVS